jgi:hypothetical protein
VLIHQLSPLSIGNSWLGVLVNGCVPLIVDVENAAAFACLPCPIHNPPSTFDASSTTQVSPTHFNSYRHSCQVKRSFTFSPPSHSMTLPLPHGVTSNELFQAFLTVLQQAPRIPLYDPMAIMRPVVHDCTPACHFIVNGCIYVCRVSNNIHCCTSSICRHLSTDTDEEMQVCTITANCYPLELVLTEEMESNERLSAEIKIKHIRADVSVKCSKRVRQQYESSIMEKNRLHTQHVLQQVLRPITISDTGQSLYSQTSLIRRISQTVDELWLLITRTKRYQNGSAYSYRHNYHVLTVLYQAITGLEVNGQQLVQQEPLIKQHLPPFKNIEKTASVNVSTFTKTKKIFRACLNELYPDS